jgi:hypothetical protein
MSTFPQTLINCNITTIRSCSWHPFERFCSSLLLRISWTVENFRASLRWLRDSPSPFCDATLVLFVAWSLLLRSRSHKTQIMDLGQVYAPQLFCSSLVVVFGFCGHGSWSIDNKPFIPAPSMTALGSNQSTTRNILTDQSGQRQRHSRDKSNSSLGASPRALANIHANLD